MKKLIIFCFLIAISFSVNAQQLSDYYDAVSDGRDGFSYTITVRIQKTADNNYTATLLQVTPDSKGYYDAYRRKLYTCSQLGNVCQPNNFGRLSIATRYKSNGQEETTGNYSFTRLNETVVLGMKITGSAIDGKPRDASNFKLELTGSTLAVSHTSEIQTKISQLENSTSSRTLSGTTSAASSNNSSSTNQSSTTQTASPIPSLESQYAKVGIPTNTPTYTKSEITTQVVTGMVGLLNEWAEDSRRKKEQEEQLREERAERERVAAEIRREKIAAHINFITAIKDAKLPLSSSNIEEGVIYYFAFSADKSGLATTRPTINLTDIFPIAKYNDDTWPYTAGIKKELSAILKSPDIILTGYYKNKSQAESDYAIFMESLRKLNFTITKSVYKGNAKENASNDVWGDAPRKAADKSTDEDFWGNSVKKPEKNTIDKPVKQDGTKTKQKSDFWEN